MTRTIITSYLCLGKPVGVLSSEKGSSERCVIVSDVHWQAESQYIDDKSEQDLDEYL